MLEHHSCVSIVDDVCTDVRACSQRLFAVNYYTLRYIRRSKSEAYVGRTRIFRVLGRGGLSAAGESKICDPEVTAKDPNRALRVQSRAIPIFCGSSRIFGIAGL